MVDRNIEQKNGLNFVKLGVEVQIIETLLEQVYFKIEKGQIMEQQITYDWQPTICGICSKYGHRKNKANEGKDQAQNQVE